MFWEIVTYYPSECLIDEVFIELGEKLNIRIDLDYLDNIIYYKREGEGNIIILKSNDSESTILIDCYAVPGDQLGYIGLGVRCSANKAEMIKTYCWIVLKKDMVNLKFMSLTRIFTILLR